MSNGCKRLNSVHAGIIDVDADSVGVVAAFPWAVWTLTPKSTDLSGSRSILRARSTWLALNSSSSTPWPSAAQLRRPCCWPRPVASGSHSCGSPMLRVSTPCARRRASAPSQRIDMRSIQAKQVFRAIKNGYVNAVHFAAFQCPAPTFNLPALPTVLVRYQVGALLATRSYGLVRSVNS